jgi:hypothetical protein
MFKASACEMEFPCCARKRIEFRKIVKGTCTYMHRKRGVQRKASREYKKKKKKKRGALAGR